MGKSIVTSFAYAFGAQVISLMTTLMLTLLAPKFIGVEEFAYWQLFLTYASYVSMTRLGLSDGLYLRLGGKHYEELDYKLLSHERQLFLLFQGVISIVSIIFVSTSTLNSDRKFVLIACSICIVIVNANVFLVYIIQAVNMTQKYAISNVLQNLPWFAAAAVIAVTRLKSYKIIIIFYILGYLIAGVYLSWQAKEIVHHQYTDIKKVVEDVNENVRCGIKLMVATFSGSLIIASARMIVDASWGVEVFGYFSFSLTLANVFLTFVNQLSVVVFPALRRVRDDKQREVYFLIRNILRMILPLVMLGYFPITVFVKLFLPQYEYSLIFLPVFLPICTFDGKMQMMCGSFFKSMRKEQVLLNINLITLGLSIITAILGSFVVRNIYFVAFGILFVVALRSIVAELLLAKYMNVNILSELFQEIFLVVCFIIGAIKLPAYMMFIVYSFMYLIYIALNFGKIKKILNLNVFK